MTQGKARILANPNISVVDNEDASVFIGQTVRFRGTTVIAPGVGAVQGTESVPVGIALVVRPRIHPDGSVTMHVHPAVSTVTSTSTDGLPQISNREADTTVRLRYGEELVIGGLTNTQKTTNIDKVPILGDIPILGELFRNRRVETSRTEIVVVIRAYPTVNQDAPAHDFREGTTPQ